LTRHALLLPAKRAPPQTPLESAGNKKPATKKRQPKLPLFIVELVEAAGIEPASASDSPLALHA